MCSIHNCQSVQNGFILLEDLDFIAKLLDTELEALKSAHRASEDKRPFLVAIFEANKADTDHSRCQQSWTVSRVNLTRKKMKSIHILTN
ncbi:hypothetical protein KFK09_017903 [Dendrobium nobile]|uniref:Uncharacterized protein n=1 Tax=Dendrobium nobile TaxID=94219 RepID=A0A8T3AZR2_DENNO|nr:hypothetical protein KFK09_017903 [Dendrobium nobile]